MSEQPNLIDSLAGEEEEVEEKPTIRERMANSVKASSTSKASGKSSEKESGVSKKRSEVKPDREEAAKPTVEAAVVVAEESGDLIDVISLWPARLIVRGEGTPTGETYIFERAGAVVKVHPADVAFLMSKNRAKGESKAQSDASGCCGGGGARTYFDLL